MLSNFFISSPQGSSHSSLVNLHRLWCIFCMCTGGLWWVSGRCSSIDGYWRLSIGGGLSLSIDGWLSLPIDVDMKRAGRMWVSCCEFLVGHDPHDIAR
ncbi:hypothetical protein F2Q69_00012704 [Brassica cretica]|uniref:Uncharacterized protein n=1 Tax=Brassica cretica TaxID=69181 RepID=A0A8S9R1M9_BRACR|nr:hypothetical protein F2Q69_00012704 [Brassica cretica]